MQTSSSGRTPRAARSNLFHRTSVTLLTAGLVAGSLIAGDARAQQAPAGPSPELQEIVVTGSLIPRTDLETVSPVTIITAADIVNSGLTTVADVVRTLSADNSGTLPTAFPGAFAAGASGVALRGLTVNSTLVLIDGLRAADYALPDDGVRSFVDLNSIQIGTIERIEVLKDGASSVYGADAIAGVVNIILKKTYEGFNANVEAGDSQHGGGFEKHFDMTAGHGNLQTDHYNAYFSLEYQADNAIGVNQRGFPFNTNDYTPFGGSNNNPSPDHGPGGSIYGSVTPGTITNGNVLTGVPLPGAVSQPLRPCPASAPQITGPTGNVYCNQNQTSYLEDQPPTTRLGLAGRVTVQFNDDTTGYIHASYYQNQSQYPTSTGPSQIQTTAPNITTTIALPPTIPGPGGLGTVLNPNDPFASKGEAALINYAFGPEGSQMNYVKNRNARVVADLSGKWLDWNYSADLVLNHTWLDYAVGGELNYSQLISDVTNGTYNFINPSANSPAVLGALAPRVTTQDTSDMDTVVLRANRQLFPLPGGPLALAVGSEWRYEAEYDQNFQNNPPEIQNLGFSQAIGNRTVESVDAEIDAPVLKSLELTASGRYDHYSDFGSTANPKFGVLFKPLDIVDAAVTYSRGFRAPSFAENGSSEVEGFVNYGAPTGSPLYTAHNGDGYISSYSLGELTIGNTSIKPETSDSYVAKIDFKPIKEFSATADYYYIKKNNLITSPNQNNALTQYANGGGLPPGYTAIYDNLDSAYPTAAPRIVTITAAYTNAASEYTDGVDLDLQGHVDLGSAGSFGSLGKLDMDLSITKILGFVYSQTGSPTLEYVGLQSPYNLSSGAGTPQWRSTFTSTWTDGPFRASVNVYYVSGYKEFGTDIFGPSFATCDTVFTVGFAPQDCRVGSFTDVDLTGAYNIGDHMQVSFAVENLLDRLPPFDPLTYAGINYNPTYSQAGIVGRFFRLGFHYKL